MYESVPNVKLLSYRSLGILFSMRHVKFFLQTKNRNLGEREVLSKFTKTRIWSESFLEIMGLWFYRNSARIFNSNAFQKYVSCEAAMRGTDASWELVIRRNFGTGVTPFILFGSRTLLQTFVVLDVQVPGVDG